MSKKKQQKQVNVLSPQNYIRQRSRNLPIHGCWVNISWKRDKLASIVIARKHVSGNITYCSYLVDLTCLGVKSTSYYYNQPQSEFDDYLQNRNENLPTKETSYDLVHNIINAAIEYAEDYGFTPHKNFEQITQYFLEEDTDDIPLIEIDCGGKDGKPLYVNTGFDNPVRVNQILSQLEKTAGNGNYNYILDQGEDYEFDDDGYDDDYKNDYEIEKIKDSLSGESPDKLKELFLKSIKKSGQKNDPSNDNIKHLIALSEILIKDVIDEDVFKDYYARIETDFAIETVYPEYLPNSLFQEVENIDSEVLSYLFFDTINAIYDDADAEKAIKQFREQVGEVPAADYLDLCHMMCTGKKKRKKQLEACYKKYPDYFLFKILWLEHLIMDEDSKEAFVQLRKLLHTTTLPLTDFEISEFMAKYALCVCEFPEEFLLEKIYAFDRFIHNCPFEPYFATFQLVSSLTLLRIKGIEGYLTKNR